MDHDHLGKRVSVSEYTSLKKSNQEKNILASKIFISFDLAKIYLKERVPNMQKFTDKICAKTLFIMVENW